MNKDHIHSNSKLTIQDEPSILTSLHDLTGLSNHIEEIEKRTKKLLKIVFDFFSELGINPEYRITTSLPPNTYIWASYTNSKNEIVTVTFAYYESALSGAHKTLNIYKNGNKKSNVRELRKLYSR